jgi:hypothetical protein
VVRRSRTAKSISTRNVIPKNQKNQRAGCVGVVFLVVNLEIQAFAQDVKFKLFMPIIHSRYLPRQFATIA